MRVCLVSQEYPPGYVGGIGTQTRVKARGLMALGHEVEVLTAGEESGPPLRSREDEGVTVHELSPPGGAFAVNSTEGYWLGYTWAVLAALRRLEEEGPFDVVDFPDYGAEGLAYQLERSEDDETAVVVHLHGSLAMFSSELGWPPPGDPLLRVGAFMEDTSIEMADTLLAASGSLAELTRERLGIDAGRVEVVTGAVDVELFEPSGADGDADADADAGAGTGAAGGAGERGPRLLFVGNLVANKGFETVLEAFVALAGAHPAATLAIAGSAEEDVSARLEQRVADAGLDGRVEVLGFVEHSRLPALYRSAEVFVAPSRYEGGLGLVYLEAMACGLPVIARAAGGAAEAIEDGETGVLLERGDLEETTAAIETLLADPALRARMGAAGRERVLARFTPAAYAERVLAGYERARARRRAAIPSQTVTGRK